MTIHIGHYRTGRRGMSQEATKLRNTVCSKGHTHPPWNITGVLKIAKCESVCGFCQKETKTAANLRKHVAIHIKNERLNLAIAEGSSGRGRLEIPLSRSPSSSASTPLLVPKMELNPPSTSVSASSASLAMFSGPSRRLPVPVSTFSPSATLIAMQRSRSNFPPPQPVQPAPGLGAAGFSAPDEDPFGHLRTHNLSTKEAWTAIPASEGFKVLDLCRSLSATSTSPIATSNFLSGPSSQERMPCYNRETIFDEEWQMHMKEVHGIYLVWPDTWMRRVEVLDLDGFGGDITSVNDFVMQN